MAVQRVNYSDHEYKMIEQLQTGSRQQKQVLLDNISVIDDKAEFVHAIESELRNFQIVEETYQSMRLKLWGKQLIHTTAEEQLVYDKSQSTLSKITAIQTLLAKLIKQLNDRLTTIQKDQFKNHYQTFRVCESQMSMMLDIIQHRDEPGFEKGIVRKYESLGCCMLTSEIILRGINFKMLQSLYIEQQRFLDEYLKHIEELSVYNLSVNRLKFLTDSCHLTLSKIQSTTIMYTTACHVPLDDLFNQDPKKSERWKSLNKLIEYRVFGTKDEIQEVFRPSRQNIIFMQAFASKINDLLYHKFKSASSFTNIVKGGVRMVQYALNPSRAQRKADKFRANLNLNVVKKMFEFDSNIITKNLFGATLPYMTQSELIFIPRHFMCVDRKRVLSWLKDRNYGIEKQTLVYEEKLSNIENLSTYTKQLYVDPKNPVQRVTVRINSPYKLHTFSHLSEGKFNLFRQPATPVEAIVMHIHGGGFICQNTFLHQMYTRRWAKGIQVPFFSVDYRKSPEYPYPAALDDCFQVYMWLVTFFDQVYDAKPPKIILVGDSAGANLCLGVAALAVKFRLRIPDALVLIYPGIDLWMQQYSPSKLICLEDHLLSASLIRTCSEAYIPGEELNPQLDPFISPIRLNKKILQQLPRTRIFLGSNDPLYDDGIRFTERLKNAGCRVKTTVYEGFPHGFLQLDMPGKGIQLCRLAIQQIQDTIHLLVWNKCKQ